MKLMTKSEAQALAKHDRSYYAKAVRNTRGRFWGVWCARSDHWVEFNRGHGIDDLMLEDLYREKGE